MSQVQPPWDNDPMRAMVSRRRFVTLIGLGSTGALLVACGSSSPKSSPTAGGTDAPSTTTAGGPGTTIGGAPGTTIAGAPGTTAAGSASAPKRGGRLRFASTGGGGNKDTLDPIHVLYDPDLARAHQLFDQPFHFDNKGAVVNGLVEEATASADAKVWTMRLRSGVTFHDGKSLTADDFIYSLQQIMDKAKPGSGAGAIAAVDVANLKKIDNLTIEVPCLTAFSTLPSTLCGVFYYIIPTTFDATKPVGTGPYKFGTFTPGADSVFTRNDSYWQAGLPYADEVQIVDYADETSMLNALLAGQIDLAQVSSNTQAKQVTDAGGGAVVSKTGSYVPFVMRTDQAPFDNVKVRTAFKLIVDRDQLNKQVYDGAGAIGNDVFGFVDPLYDSSLPQRKVDIEQAKALLKEAGAEGLSIELTTSQIGPGAVQAAQVFAEQAKAAGVKVTVRTMTSTEFFGDTYLSRPFTQDLWFSKPYLANVNMATGPSAQYNETHFSDAHYNDLYQQALATADPAKLTGIVHEMMKIDYDTGGYIIPTFLPNTDCFGKGVHGVVESVLGIPFNEYDLKSLWLD